MYYWKIETTWKQNKLSDCWKLTKITTVSASLQIKDNKTCTVYINGIIWLLYCTIGKIYSNNLK